MRPAHSADNALRSMRMYRDDRGVSVDSVVELRTPVCIAGAQKGAASSRATMLETAGGALPRIVAILIILLALSVPVLLIVWRLHRSYS